MAYVVPTDPRMTHRIFLDNADPARRIATAFLCASLARLLGLEVGPPTKRLRAVFDRLLVADWNGQRFAFPVDEVHGVHRFHQADLREPPATVARSGLHCTAGVFPWRNLAVGFLDADTIFTALNRNLA